MTQPNPRRPDPSRPRAGQLVREVGRDVVRSIAEGLVVVLVTALAVLVLAGGLGWLGSALAGTAGTVLGVLSGLGLVGLAWLVLVSTGAADAVRLVLRGRFPRDRP